MPRKISRKGLIRKLDKVFSIYIRTRKSKNDIVECVTCGVKKHWKEVDAGHFVSRRHYATRWNPKNVHVQCKSCNGFHGGQNYLMGNYINKTYGDNTADNLITMSRQIKKYTNQDLLDLIDYFEKLV